MFQRKFGVRSASRYAWIVPVVLGMTVLLIFLAGSRESSDTPQLDLLQQSPSQETWRIGDPSDDISKTSAGVLSKDKRQDVHQNLSEFRAKYKLVAPGISVTATQENTQGETLSRAIGEMLSHYNLGRYEPDPAVPEMLRDERDRVMLFSRKTDLTVARAFLQAISPMISGEIVIRFVPDNEFKKGSMLLLISADVEFDQNGKAIF